MNRIVVSSSRRGSPSSHRTRRDSLTLQPAPVRFRGRAASVTAAEPSGLRSRLQEVSPVPMMCAVSFERYGRLYYFDAGELTPSGRATRCWCRPTKAPRSPSASGRRSGSTSRSRCRALVGIATEVRPGPRRAASRPARRGSQGGQAAGPRARPADEAGRHRLRAHRRPRHPRTRPTGAARATPSTSARRSGSTSGRSYATWPARCPPGSSCVRSARVTRPASRAASARAVVTCAARRSSRTSSRSRSGWPRTRTCRSTR